MRKGLKKHITQITMPSVLFSIIVGALTGGLIFAFRVVSEEVIHLSSRIFGFADAHLWAVPLVVLGGVLIALLVTLFQVYSPHSKGGGIPTAVGLMRGLITFNWLRNVIFVFASALASFLCGIPLGNDEGPSVQMGTAVGSGTTRVLGRKQLAWERYLMTGGATAGFAVATCAPISAVMFGVEEAHRRISPLLLVSSITSVLSGMVVMRLLCIVTGRMELISLFHIEALPVLRLRQIWMAVIIGIVCGATAYVFSWMTQKLRALLRRKNKKVNPFFKVVPAFAVVTLIGCFFYEYNVIGTGHHLIEDLLGGHRMVWYAILLVLAVRALLVVLSYEAGATGGLFTPLLVFGALIGALAGEILVSVQVLSPEYIPLTVVIGMAAFLSSAARIPLTAAAFSLEALGGLENFLPIFAAILVSYVVVETMGGISINELALEREVHKQNKGKVRRVVDVRLTAKAGAFAIGKEPRDILWPAFCHVLSVLEGEEDEKDSYEGGAIKENDILRLNFTTYDPDATAAELCAILGEQPVYEKADVEYHGAEHEMSKKVSKHS